MTVVDTREFPGFQLPDAPRFNHADGATMFAGELTRPAAILDFAMVFGSRLWGHEPLATFGMVHDADTSNVNELGVALSEATTPGVGDLYTHELRERANEALTERVSRELDEPADGWRSLILHTGSEAVETAIKTALRATGRTRLVAFEGGYHGTFGLALAVTHRPEFRDPWASQFAGTVTFEPWGAIPKLDEDVAAVVVEPWQGRAGVIPPPDGFLAGLRAECDRVGALLVLDAVLCGAGRTGPVVASRLAEARPDLLCLGKAIGCGVTASAVVARAEAADAAWQRGPVEPAHTSTSIGDPLACAGILRALDRLDTRERDLATAASLWQAELGGLAERTGLTLRGTGLLWALDTGHAGLGMTFARVLLHEHRMLVVPSGVDSSSITLYPSVGVVDWERDKLLRAIEAVLAG